MQTDPLGFDAGDPDLYRYCFGEYSMGYDPEGLDSTDGSATATISKDGCACDERSPRYEQSTIQGRWSAAAAGWYHDNVENTAVMDGARQGAMLPLFRALGLRGVLVGVQWSGSVSRETRPSAGTGEPGEGPVVGGGGAYVEFDSDLRNPSAGILTEIGAEGHVGAWEVGVHGGSANPVVGGDDAVPFGYGGASAGIGPFHGLAGYAVDAHGEDSIYGGVEIEVGPLKVEAVGFFDRKELLTTIGRMAQDIIRSGNSKSAPGEWFVKKVMREMNRRPQAKIDPCDSDRGASGRSDGRQLIGEGVAAGVVPSMRNK